MGDHLVHWCPPIRLVLLSHWSLPLPLVMPTSGPVAVFWAAEHWCPVVFRDASQTDSVVCSLKGHLLYSLPPRKRESLLKVSRNEMNIIGHWDSGRYQKLGAWMMEWILSKDGNFLLKGLVLWKTALDGEVPPGHFKFIWPPKNRVTIFSTCEYPYKKNPGKTTINNQAPQEPLWWQHCSRVSCFWNSVRDL